LRKEKNKMKIRSIKNKPMATLAIAFLVLATLLATASFVSAAPVGVVTIVDQATGTSISTYAEGTYTPGETMIAVDLEISSGSGIWGIGCDRLTWNPEVVQCLAVEEGPYLKGSGIPKNPTIFVAGTPNNEVGEISNGFGGAISSGTTTSNLEAGVYATVYFQVIGAGDANIVFHDVSFSDGVNPPVYQEVNQATITFAGQFVVPEYTLGALAALGAAFAAFVGFVAFKKGFSLPAFSKHI
jgi:hypothetical protein